MIRWAAAARAARTSDERPLVFVYPFAGQRHPEDFQQCIETLAKELPAGITVNNVLPGFTDTERLRSLIVARAEKADQSPDIVARAMVDSVPAGRFGEPDEVGAVIAFLASPAASYLTGVSIPVDGGRTSCI